MTVARSVGDVLTEHVQFEIECIDRMYLNVYVPHLQFAAGLVGYVQRQLGLPIASTAGEDHRRVQYRDPSGSPSARVPTRRRGGLVLSLRPGRVRCRE